jgi:hypothetical protein
LRSDIYHPTLGIVRQLAHVYRMAGADGVAALCERLVATALLRCRTRVPPASALLSNSSCGTVLIESPDSAGVAAAMCAVLGAEPRLSLLRLSSARGYSAHGTGGMDEEEEGGADDTGDACGVHGEAGFGTAEGTRAAVAGHPHVAWVVGRVRRAMRRRQGAALVLCVDGVELADGECEVEGRPSLSAALRSALAFSTCATCWRSISRSRCPIPELLLLFVSSHISLLPAWVSLPSSGPGVVGSGVDPLLVLPPRGGTGVDAWVRVGGGGEGRAPAPPPSPWGGWGGYAPLKAELEGRVVRPFRGAAAAMGLRPPAGVLLYGPPGTGKTLAACSLARACGAVLLHVSCSGLLSRYVGDSEAGLRRLFAAARSLAPCTLLLDGVDAIATARGGLEGRGVSPLLDRLLATLLSEMDGLQGCGGVLLVATATVLDGTPLPLDAALLRPGRLDVCLAVGGAGAADREALLSPLGEGLAVWAAGVTGGWDAHSLSRLVSRARVEGARRADGEGLGEWRVGRGDVERAAAWLGKAFHPCAP